MPTPTQPPPPAAGVLEWRQVRFRAMGTDCQLIVHGHRRLLATGWQRVEELEARWSRFRADSEISRLGESGGWHAVSADTAAVLARAKTAWELTGGAFDMTLGGPVSSWGYDRTYAALMERDRRAAQGGDGSAGSRTGDAAGGSHGAGGGSGSGSGANGHGGGLDSGGDPGIAARLRATGATGAMAGAAGGRLGAGLQRGHPAPGADGGGPPLPRAPVSLAAEIEVDEARRAVHVPAGVRIDLGGIGKGFAADLVAARLMDDGAAGVVVNLGGDVRVAGDPRMGGGCAHGWGWHIDVTVDGGVLGQLCVASGGAATSSPTARQWTQRGRGVHHLFDPATRAPAIGGARAVTVVAAEAWQAEAVATAACVVPADEAAALLAGTGLSGFVLNPDRTVTPVGDIGRFQHDQVHRWTT